LSDFGKFAIDAGSRFIGGTVAQAVTNKGGRVNFGQVAADAFGNALGNSIAQGITGSGSQQAATLANNRSALNAANQASDPSYYSIAAHDPLGDLIAQNPQWAQDGGWRAPEPMGPTYYPQPGSPDFMGPMPAQDLGFTRGRIQGSVSRTLGGDKLLMGEFARLNPGVNINNVRADRDYNIPTSVADANVANASFQTVANGWAADARQPIAAGVNPSSPQTSLGANSVPILKNAADEMAAKAVQAYNTGDNAQGDKYLGYASQYYKAAGDAQSSRSVVVSVSGGSGHSVSEATSTRMFGSDSTRITVSGNRVAPLLNFAHAEIQISNGYEFTVLEGQPGYGNLNRRLEGRTNGANTGDAFAIEFTPTDGRTTAQLASDLKTAARSYQDNLVYSFPSPRYRFNNLNGGYNSNSYVGGLLMAAGLGSESRWAVQLTARSQGFSVPGMENPIPLPPVKQKP
jgi:hypothetical protein